MSSFGVLSVHNFGLIDISILGVETHPDVGPFGAHSIIQCDVVTQTFSEYLSISNVARSLITLLLKLQSNTIHMFKNLTDKEDRNIGQHTLGSPKRSPTPIPTFYRVKLSPSPSNLSFEHFAELLWPIRCHCGPSLIIRVPKIGCETLQYSGNGKVPPHLLEAFLAWPSSIGTAFSKGSLHGYVCRLSIHQYGLHKNGAGPEGAGSILVDGTSRGGGTFPFTED